MKSLFVVVDLLLTCGGWDRAVSAAVSDCVWLRRPTLIKLSQNVVSKSPYDYIRVL